MHIVLSAGKREGKKARKGISGIRQLEPKQQIAGPNPRGLRAWPVSSFGRWDCHVFKLSVNTPSGEPDERHVLNLLVPKDAAGLQKQAHIHAGTERGSTAPKRLGQVKVRTSLCSWLRWDTKSVKA